MTLIAGAAFPVALLGFLALGAIFLSLRDGDETPPPRGPTLIASGLFILLVLLRAPALLTFHRVWAEAGNLYFGYAYEHGPLSALTRQVSNYFDLTANLSSAVAVLLGLRFWPVVDTVFGYLPMLALPVALAALGFRPRQRAGLMLVIACSLYSIQATETFGTMLHVKAWGGIYTFLVLVSLASGETPTRTHKGLLLILPLTGPIATLLLLVQGALSALLRPFRSYRVLLWALPGLALQLLCTFGTSKATGLAARPASLSSLVEAANLLLTKGFAALFDFRLLADTSPPSRLALVASNMVLVLVLAAALFFYVRRPERRDFWLLVPVQFGHFAATVLFALGGAATIYANASGMRYFFPAVSMALIFLVTTKAMEGALPRYALVAALAAMILIDHRANRTTDPLFFAPRTPSWQSQVEALAKAPGAPLSTYPQGWQFTLPDCGEHYCGAR